MAKWSSVSHLNGQNHAICNRSLTLKIICVFVVVFIRFVCAIGNVRANDFDVNHHNQLITFFSVSCIYIYSTSFYPHFWFISKFFCWRCWRQSLFWNESEVKIHCAFHIDLLTANDGNSVTLIHVRIRSDIWLWPRSVWIRITWTLFYR